MIPRARAILEGPALNSSRPRPGGRRLRPADRVAIGRGDLERIVERVERLEHATRAGTPFPLLSVLEILAGAVDHLEEAHDCDGDGWETRRRARDAARLIVAGLKGQA